MNAVTGVLTVVQTWCYFFVSYFSTGPLIEQPPSYFSSNEWPSSVVYPLLFLLLSVTLAFLWLYPRYKRLRGELSLHETAKMHFLVKSEKADLEGNRARDMFMIQVSHVLRTPLNVIIGYSELLSETCAERGYEDVLPDIQKIQLSGRDLSENINHMLQLTRVASGRKRVSYDRFPTRVLIQDLEKAIESEIRRSDNRFEVVEEGMPDCLDTDIEKVREILLHLLFISLKNTYDGLIRLEIKAEGTPGSNQARFVISDNGRGMNENLLDELFREYLDNGQLSRSEHTDTHLGLVICKTLCRNLGGDLEMETRAHEGNRFHVTLPALPETAVSSEDGQTEGRSHGSRVLLIDDDPQKISSLASMLQQEGVKVETYLANDRPPRFSRFQRPELIVVDAMMTRLRGRMIFEALGRSTEMNQVPLLLMTMMDDVGVTYRLGVIGYLVKPVKEPHLLNILNRVLPGKPKSPILLVEDDRTTRAMMRRALERAGWNVSEASTPEEALARAQEQRPALVLLDLILHGRSGYDFFRDLRQLSGRETVPVIFVSASHISAESRLSPGKVHLIHYNGHSRDEDAHKHLKRQVLVYSGSRQGENTP